MPLSLYVHIPFCLKRCIYCDFVSGIYNPEKEDSYLKALKKEILNISNETSFSTLYIGGGTPTTLSTDALSDLITHIFKHLKFIENYEATIETNPGTLDREKLQAIRSSGINPAPAHRCGINRISIGVQSFNDTELNCLGRLHSSDDAEQAVYLARDAGFENIGIDLIYGIPGQTIKSWEKTIKKAVSLKPKHISTYELTVEKGTLLYEYMNNPPLPLPTGQAGPFSKGGKRGFVDEEKIIEMYNHVIDYLTTTGFIHYEISNFAMPDYFCRHNLNYWDRGEYYGVGLGAHSFIKGKRFYNTDNLEDYIKTISGDKSPVKETEDITEDKALSEAIFLGLRKTRGVNLESFTKTYGKDIMVLFREIIRDLIEAELLELENNNLRLSRRGLLLSNEIFTRFI